MEDLQTYLWLFGQTCWEPRLLHSHALDYVGCMQLSLRLSKSITVNKQVFKNNKDAIENIDLENKATYF